jgi:thiamine biosynthesis protein ThiS
MTITVNGQSLILETGLKSVSTLLGVLQTLGIDPTCRIVVHNGVVVTGDLNVLLQEGDDVEILHFVGGGCPS